MDHLSRHITGSLRSLRAWSGRCLRERWVELAVAALVLANSAAYLAVSENLIGGTGGWTVTVSQLRQTLAEDGFLAWVQRQNYYPPLYFCWLGLCSPAASWVSPTPLVLWSDLLMIAGLLGLAAALRRCGAGRLQVGATVLLLAATPAFNAFTKLLTYECGMLGAAGLLLALLARPEALASVRIAALAGAVTAAGLLFKWTFFLYAAGPVLVAAVTAWRREGWRRCAAGLAAYAAAATVLAGPWFAFCLDWARLRETASNDASFPGLGGWNLYRAGALEYLGSHWPVALGPWLVPFFLAGLAAALVWRQAGAGLLLSSALLPALALPAMVHVEGRYLLPALPGLAGAAGLGLGALAGRARAVVAVAVVCCCLVQLSVATWFHWWTPGREVRPGPQGAFDEFCYMSFDSRPQAAARLLTDAGLWAAALGTPLAELALHPLNTQPGLQLEVLRYLRVINGIQQEAFALYGYDWHEYVHFLRELRSDRFAFLALPQGMFGASPESVANLTDTAWSYIDQVGGAAPRSREARPPDDRLLMDLISQKFLALERIQDPQGDVWLLVSRRYWEGLVRTHPRLPELAPFAGPASTPLRTVSSTDATR
jgi:hypothetical protein